MAKSRSYALQTKEEMSHISSTKPSLEISKTSPKGTRSKKYKAAKTLPEEPEEVNSPRSLRDGLISGNMSRAISTVAVCAVGGSTGIGWTILGVLLIWG